MTREGGGDVTREYLGRGGGVVGCMRVPICVESTSQPARGESARVWYLTKECLSNLIVAVGSTASLLLFPREIRIAFCRVVLWLEPGASVGSAVSAGGTVVAMIIGMYTRMSSQFV
jgi:hypothetical protein